MTATIARTTASCTACCPAASGATACRCRRCGRATAPAAWNTAPSGCAGGSRIETTDHREALCARRALEHLIGPLVQALAGDLCRNGRSGMHLRADTQHDLARSRPVRTDALLGTIG
ncbi:hypothetical protein OF001_U10280 [Pseudomonas sp. OF001]|nr:hypothetical protein OF001_U10280 [Pseudomonas sp. OF001]